MLFLFLLVLAAPAPTTIVEGQLTYCSEGSEKGAIKIGVCPPIKDNPNGKVYNYYIDKDVPFFLGGKRITPLDFYSFVWRARPPGTIRLIRVTTIKKRIIGVDAEWELGNAPPKEEK